MCAFRMSNDLKNALCGNVISYIAGADGTDGLLTISAGPQPGDAGSDGTGGTLCVIGGIAWNSTTSGTASLASTTGYAGTAIAAGTAGWGRLEYVGTAGTCRIDGDIGTSAAHVFMINVNNFSSGGVITLLSADIYMA